MLSHGSKHRLLFFTLTAFLAAAPAGGQTLRETAHEIMKMDHQPIGYSQTDEAMREIYADPVTPGNILLFYTGRSQDADRWVSDDSADGWNREHIWPQSRGMGGAPMKSDLHNLMPTDASVNQRRGNLNFDDGGDPEGEAPGTFLDGDSFEPRDEVKGNVARAAFYVDVRYEGGGGEPDLSLVDELAPAGGTTLGRLCTLLAWHEADPPTDVDVERNDMIEAVQGNRNLFIDDPSLASALFGAACGAPDGGDTPDPAPPDAPQAGLRIGTWNIANLHHESGVPLRPGATARDDVDFERLAGVAEDLDLDIIALQEIGSPAAARRVFPETEYHLVISERYALGDENRPTDDRDIYVAMAFAKERFPEAPAVETFWPLSIGHVAIDRDGTPSVRPTRAGLVADIMLMGQPVKILGVHLKSACHGWSLDPVTDQNMQSGQPFDSRFDCRTLAAQQHILENWIEQQAALGVRTIILGDFNRRMNYRSESGEDLDHFWTSIDDGTPNALDLAKGPTGIDEICWPAHSDRFEEHIDFIVFDAALSDDVAISAPEKVSMGFENDPRYGARNRQRLSDHCPVVAEFEQ